MENSKQLSKRKIVTSLSEVDDDKFYKVADLQSILANLNLNASIFSIRDAETWKCTNYECGFRHTEPVEKCTKCGGEIRNPLIISPRTRGGGKGVGHRRYTGKELKEIVAVFKETR